MNHVLTTELRDHLSECLARAERGEEIVVLRHGKPMARRGPIASPVERACADLLVWRAGATLGDVTSPVLPDEWEML